MKPFNLEQALAGKPVVTRTGLPVTEIHEFKTEISYYIICGIINGTSYWFAYDGIAAGGEVAMDLFMAPEKRQGWVNLYKAAKFNFFMAGRVYETEEKAISDAKYIDHYKTTIMIEWEE